MHSQTNPGTNPAAPRLYFLDWIRILAFMLLVLYHTGMYYVSWDWHVKSVDASHAIEPLMLLSSPWRLGLLFLIAGVASACMLQKTPVAAFVRGRSVRLLPPLLFGMLVIVPPQSYFEVVEKLSWQGDYKAFMRLYLAGYHGFCRPEGCLSLPTWNHLWFVAYLWVYALLLGGAVWLAGARFLLADNYPQTHALIGDCYSHAQYGALFVLARCWRRKRPSGSGSMRCAGPAWACRWLKPAHLAPQLEGTLLVTLTLCLSFGGFELVRRSAVLRPLFGLAISRTSAYAPPRPAAAASAYPPATAPGHRGNTATADDRSARQAG